MPRKNPEHGGRFEIRLPKAMLHAMRWTAEHAGLPVSDWARNVLNDQTYGVNQHKSIEYLVEDFASPIAERPADSSTAGPWRGKKRDKTKTIRIHKDMDGRTIVGSLPPGLEHEQRRQDFEFDRAEARSELRTWLNKYGRDGKTLRLSGQQQRMARKLLATFDGE